MVGNNPGVLAPIDEVRQLKTLINDIYTGLKNQQELLKLRDMSLPPGTMQCITAIQTNLQKLEETLQEDERELNQLRALVATSAMINTSLDLDTVLANAMDEILKLTGAERGYILLKNPVTGELEFRIAREQDADAKMPASGGYQISTTILNEVITTGQPLLTDNAFKDPRTRHAETVTQFVLRSVLCVPLQYKDDIIGAVYVDNRFRVAVFTERELTLLQAFANQTAVAIENARLFSSTQSALEEITEMKELIENVFTSIESGVITTDANDNITTYNRAASNILGQEPGQSVGKPLQSVMPVMGEEFDRLLDEVREHNQSPMVEAEPEIPGIGRKVLRMKLSPLKDAEQNTQGVAMVLDDLTEEREREEVVEVMRGYLPPGMMDNIHRISRLALGGERREISCMFADVCPIPQFPRDLRPHQLMEMLNVYLTRATNAVHNVDGVIDKYMGSEIMVLFNTQLNPLANHALRAVEAALELREALMQLHYEMGLGGDASFFRMGIHSGVATLGNVGSSKRRNFTAIGDSINLAKRLQENSSPGQIIVSQDVLRYIQEDGPMPDTIRFEERGMIQVKGRQQPAPIYEVFRK